MQKTSNRHAKRLLFVFSDTGGGHRSTAQAVAQVLQDVHGEQAQIECVDGFRNYAPWPFSQLGNAYPHMVRLRGWPWAVGWHLSNGPRRIAFLTGGTWPVAHTAALRLLYEHPADVIVCCHPCLSDPILRALRKTKNPTPLITLVTDLSTAHAFWFVPGVTCCLVPTESVRRQALACGLPAEHVLVTGLPVGPHFISTAREAPTTVQKRLRLRPDLPLVLLISGGEGMGPLHRLCRAVAHSGVQAQLVTIVGRNERLRARLAAEAWPLPMRVQGFVHDVHEWMQAADLLVTKAGPSTISEALVIGLPIVLSGALPGQERPNVDYVVRGGAGIWAPTPGRVAAAVRELLAPSNPRLTEMVACARALAQPDAAWRVAEIVWNTATQ